MDSINQAQTSEKEVSYWVDMAEALKRLERNEDFKKVIEEGYFKDKAISGVSILASDQIKASGRRTDVMEGLIAISSLQDHFYTIKAMGQAIEDEAEYDDEEDSNEAIGTETLEG
jgi:hypothetical protein